MILAAFTVDLQAGKHPHSLVSVADGNFHWGAEAAALTCED